MGFSLFPNKWIFYAPNTWRLEHGRQQWPPGEMRAEIIDHEPADRGAGFHRRAAVMRLHDDIGQL